MFNLKEFRDNGLPCGGARPTLFEVMFHNLGEADANKMAYLACNVHTMINKTLSDIFLNITILEREDGFVADRLDRLDGPVTILEYGKTGKITRETHYDFKVIKVENDLGWDMNNKIKTWEVQGTAVVVKE